MVISLVLGTFGGDVCIWSIAGETPFWLHQIHCSARAISALTAVTDSRTGNMKVYAGTEDGFVLTLAVREHGSKVRLRVVDSADPFQAGSNVSIM